MDRGGLGVLGERSAQWINLFVEHNHNLGSRRMRDVYWELTAWEQNRPTERERVSVLLLLLLMADHILIQLWGGRPRCDAELRSSRNHSWFNLLVFTTLGMDCNI